MSLTIKIRFIGLVFLGVFILSSNLQAQEVEAENASEENKEHVLLSFGYIQPFAFGNNIANKAYSISGGAEHSVWVRPALDIWVGAKISIFGADVENKELTGNYNDVNIVSIGPMLGYKFHFDQKFGLLLGGGVGYVKYTNHHPDYKFYDDGTALWFTVDAEYDLTDHFGFYLSGELRRDFLKAELPIVDEHYFKNNYFVFALGVRVTI